MFKDLRNARKNKNKGKKDKKEKVILSWVIFQFVCNFFLFLGGGGGEQGGGGCAVGQIVRCNVCFVTVLGPRSFGLLVSPLPPRPRVVW